MRNVIRPVLMLVAIALLAGGCGGREVRSLRAVDWQNGTVILLRGDDAIVQRIYDPDFVIVGGSLSGLTAAMAACASGWRTLLIEDTAQLAACFADTNSYFENRYIGTTGSSIRVKQFRDYIRGWYRKYGGEQLVVESDIFSRFADFGSTGFCFGTDAALAAVDSILSVYQDRGRLTVLTRHEVAEVITFKGRVTSVNVIDLDEHIAHQVRGWMYVDATETGELLPLAGFDFAIGSDPADSAAAYDVFFYEDTLAGSADSTAVVPLLDERPVTEGRVETVVRAREPRRLRAIKNVTADDIAVASQPGPRAAFFDDSVGIGYSPMVVFSSPRGEAEVIETRPFQIPLSAMVPPECSNFLAGGASIGTTYPASSAYTAPSVLMAIGESAGVVMEYCAADKVSIHDILADKTLLRSLQEQLVGKRGIPIYWYDNIMPGEGEFPEAQMKPFEDPEFRDNQDSLSYNAMTP
ncbi:FAD-dependent oxidoreductase [Candidatus Latescibacterota bacterium]